ncbi:hypothetical protein NQ318_002785 [Aromia moschata]|uniref:SOCS box domain-containing protein n=1 Tax=Aromia moschata TaxID=1265417 RepID=A0AAV8XSF0_9CUCU|nr:hypothetical protein NQ318_002785 [Aromia moschata]
MAEDIGKPPQKQYDYLLKFLLVGDSDVGKQEILSDLDDGALESPFCSGSGKSYKTTTILLDGKRVKLQLWDTSGQGRFCTIIRSYSRGAQGVLLEVDEHAPGVPKVLVGNRLHLAFNRKVGQRDAQVYANKHSMAFFEVSPLCNFNIHESFCELSRMALQRNGMERLWRSNKVLFQHLPWRFDSRTIGQSSRDLSTRALPAYVIDVRWAGFIEEGRGGLAQLLSLQELCCRAIVARTTVYSIEQLPLPTCVKSHLKSYALTSTSTQLKYTNSQKKGHGRKLRFTSTPASPGAAADGRTSCVPRNSCTVS